MKPDIPICLTGHSHFAAQAFLRLSFGFHSLTYRRPPPKIFVNGHPFRTRRPDLLALPHIVDELYGFRARKQRARKTADKKKPQAIATTVSAW
jgi:hypothetical protein